MPREIATYQPSLAGSTLYALLRKDGLWWDGTASTFTVADPAGSTAADYPVDVAVQVQAGASPAPATDALVAAGTLEPVVAAVDKTGYKLAADGLDAISVADPGGVANMTTLPRMMVALWRRAYGKVALSPTQLTTYADGGTTINTTQAVSDDGSGNQTQGAAS
jgi:hypothetical protein